MVGIWKPVTGLQTYNRGLSPSAAALVFRFLCPLPHSMSPDIGAQRVAAKREGIVAGVFWEVNGAA
jgi:hypothetical protein